MSSTLLIDEIEDQREVLYDVNSKSWADHWTIIDPTGLSAKAANTVHRLNGYGSHYYFAKVILRRHRLREYLHKELCDIFESTRLKEIIEWPRDHFKSTIGSESAPIWWALPFNYDDEVLMRSLGYGDEFISWMYRAHNRDTRTLLVSENKDNIGKLGVRVDNHYQNNDFFLRLYPEIKPDSSCTWSVTTKTHKRSGKTTDGEGTFDYLSVGTALQSRHYNRVIQDDLVGKEALESEVVMKGTIDYHKLLVGAFDSDPSDPEADNDEVVIGNRWSYKDLNYWIRKNEDYFRITTHSAIGGCCPKHPANTILFPNEFSWIKLDRWKKRLGPYFFSCFPEETPILMSDFSEKKISDVMVGDEVVGFRRGVKGSSHSYASIVKTKVLAINIREAPVFEVITNKNRLVRCTVDHKWWTGRSPEKIGNYVRPEYRSILDGLKTLLSVYIPYQEETKENQRWLDWLGGVIDSEGTISSGNNVYISQSRTANPEICKGIEQCLNALKIEWRYVEESSQYYLYGGRRVKLRLLRHAKMFKLSRWHENIWQRAGQIVEEDGEHVIKDRNFLGLRRVYNIQTESGNYIAWGFATKNCQFLNNPTPPGDTKFKESYLNYYKFQIVDQTHDKRVQIVHETRAGVILKNLFPSHLRRILLLDPNHAGIEGRSRHALIVLGYTIEVPFRIYLLDLYAENSSHADLVAQLFKFGEKWKIREPWLETVGAQKWLKYHLEVISELNRKSGKWTFRKINEFKKDNSKDAKIQRIDALEPTFARGEFYCCRIGHEQFVKEYLEYPYSPTKDILDVLGYAHEAIDTEAMSDFEINDILLANKRKFQRRKVGSAGYN